MRSRFTQLYLHSVWATWDRMPLLVPAIEQTVYAAILAKCRQLDCEPLVIGGMESTKPAGVGSPPLHHRCG
jgi:hypothetical protein